MATHHCRAVRDGDGCCCWGGWCHRHYQEAGERLEVDGCHAADGLQGGDRAITVIIGSWGGRCVIVITSGLGSGHIVIVAESWVLG